MNKFVSVAVKSLLVLTPVAVCLSAAEASPVIIPDNYIGGVETDPAYHGVDVIGAESRFGVSEMAVDFTGGVLTVSIFSQYFDNVGISDTNLGDLFISTNGWNPFGPAPYVDDNSTNGEKWELALVMSNHGVKDPNGVGVSFIGQGGTADLYSVLDPNIILSNGQSPIRQLQEVQYNGAQQNALAQGTWGVFDVLGSDYDELRFIVNLSNILGIGNALGFHWTMTCANDVIEGSAPIPEPASMVLLMSALGMGAAIRRRAA